MKQTVQPPTTSFPVSPPSTTPTKEQTGRRVLINTGALAGSSLWRIVTSFVLQLIIARQLGPLGLGHYTIALAYLNICQILTELGLPALLVRDLAQMPWLRRSYFWLALSIQSVMGLLVWGGLIAVTTLLPFSDAARTILWIVGASLPLYAVTSVTQVLFQAGERMELVMGVEVLINMLILVFSIAIVLVGGTTQHLAMVLVVTQLISALLGLWLLRRSKLFALPQQPVAWQWSLLWQRSGPFYILALADVLLQRADIVLLSLIGGETLTGIYSAAYNLVRVALKLIQNLWAALYPTLSRLARQTPAHYERLCNFGLRYGLLGCLAVASIGTGVTEEFLVLVFGSDYYVSALVLKILLWSAPIYLLESYTQTLLMVEHRPLQSLWIAGSHLLALALLMPVFTVLWGAPGAAWAVLIAGIFGMGVSLRLLRRWHMPHTVAQPYLLTGLTVGIYLLSNYLPFAWLWRLLVSLIVYLLSVWYVRLIAPEDWQLTRKILRKPSDEDRELPIG